jgi:hypothetical protein
MFNIFSNLILDTHIKTVVMPEKTSVAIFTVFYLRVGGSGFLKNDGNCGITFHKLIIHHWNNLAFEHFAFLGYYSASSSISLVTFWDNCKVPWSIGHPWIWAHCLAQPFKHGCGCSMSGGSDFGKQNHTLRFIHGIVVIHWDMWADFICDLSF